MTVKLRVLGGGREVGRAAYLIEGKEKILLDYGVSFDEKDNPSSPSTCAPSISTP